MSRINPSSIIFTLLPALAIIPVLAVVISGIHGGGLNIISSFLLASLHPSLDPIVIKGAWEGLQITISIALISWVTSTFAGILLGVVSSNVFWHTFGFSKLPALFLRSCLAIPRSIHELIWGLLLLQFFGMNPVIAILAMFIPYTCLNAKVFSDQLDSLNTKSLIALKQLNSKPLSAIFTALIPPIIPVITSYGGYRLECALRGATLLGIFGLGGIGTEIQLTLQSLEFNELWTSLWTLAILIFSLEKLLSSYRKIRMSSITSEQKFLFTLVIMSIIMVTGFLWLQILGINLSTSIVFHPINLPTLSSLKSALLELPLFNLIVDTLLITILSAGIAIGIPPLLMALCPSKTSRNIQSIVWAFLRLIPAPVTAILLLFFTVPSNCLASLALGLHNLGIMGRLLKESLSSQSDNSYLAIQALGASNRSSWIYGRLSLKSKSYLAYAAYRTEVILRETAVVGIVGGAGLGWQLQESLSSFAWGQVLIITTTYITITLIGENLREIIYRQSPTGFLLKNS